MFLAAELLFVGGGGYFVVKGINGLLEQRIEGQRRRVYEGWPAIRVSIVSILFGGIAWFNAFRLLIAWHEGRFRW